MLGIYDNGKINIISQSHNKYGKVTETIAYENLDCRIESINKPVKDQHGRELMADTLIMISNPDISIKWDDKIQIRKIDGDTIDIADKKYVIKSKFQVSEFVASHWEVYL